MCVWQTFCYDSKFSLLLLDLYVFFLTEVCASVTECMLRDFHTFIAFTHGGATIRTDGGRGGTQFYEAVFGKCKNVVVDWLACWLTSLYGHIAATNMRFIGVFLFFCLTFSQCQGLWHFHKLLAVKRHKVRK